MRKLAVLTFFFLLLFVLPPEILLSSNDNLLTNPGFENGLISWETKYPSTVTVAIEESVRHMGTKALRVIKESSKGWGYAYQDVRVSGGNYKLSGWVRWDDEKIASVKLRLELFDAAGKKVGSPQEVAASERKAEFQFLELAAEIGEEVQTARIEGFVNQDEPNPLKPALFDDLEFVAGGEEPEPPPEPPAWPTKISLSEFMPDPPKGEKEWVEIFNGGDSTAVLDDWQIDDIEGGGSPVSFSAVLAPKSYYTIEISKSLLNNAGDSVRLLRSDDLVVETVSYASSQKGVAWAKDAQGAWQQTTTPTPAAVNKITSLVGGSVGGPAEDTVVPDKITLSEFYPNPPAGGETEWVEIFNHNPSAVELEDWQIDDQEGGGSPKTFSVSIGARSYFVLDLKTKALLNNGGDEVRLLKPNGSVADAFAYKKSVKGIAWARDAQGEWQLTTIPTSGKVNQIVKYEEKQDTEEQEEAAVAAMTSTDQCPSCSPCPLCPACPFLAAATVAAASACPPATVLAAEGDAQGQITPQAWSDDKTELIAAEARADRLAAQNAQLEQELYLWQLKTGIGGGVVFCLLLIACVYFKFGR
ncbi:MAG: lamin tail domain-containing protein [bacterium]|nr:lamin tail domain-containing protein [bacterium]